MTDNPYSPPKRGGGAPSQLEADAISFNDFDLERVSRATTWMRRVSSLQFVFGVLLLVLTAITAARGRAALSVSLPFAITVGSMAGYAVLLVLGAVWLRQSCVAFYDGIMANAETGLAVGFRKLRLYLIMYGTLGVIGLGVSLLGIIR